MNLDAKLMTVADVAERTQYSCRTIDRAVDSGRLQWCGLTRAKRFTAEAVAAWLAAEAGPVVEPKRSAARKPPAPDSAYARAVAEMAKRKVRR